MPVVSARISDAQQRRLRRMANARGVTVSDLVRFAVLGEIGCSQRVTTFTAAPGGLIREIGRGFVWSTVPGAWLNGNTFTY